MPNVGLTPASQKILISLLSSEYISASSQKWMSTHRFYKIIHFLKENNLVKKCCVVCDKVIEEDKIIKCQKNDWNHRHNKEKYSLYTLTIKGEVLAYILKQFH